MTLIKAQNKKKYSDIYIKRPTEFCWRLQLLRQFVNHFGALQHFSIWHRAPPTGSGRFSTGPWIAPAWWAAHRPPHAQAMISLYNSLPAVFFEDYLSPQEFLFRSPISVGISLENKYMLISTKKQQQVWQQCGCIGEAGLVLAAGLGSNSDPGRGGSKCWFRALLPPPLPSDWMVPWMRHGLKKNMTEQ